MSVLALLASLPLLFGLYLLGERAATSPGAMHGVASADLSASPALTLEQMAAASARRDAGVGDTAGAKPVRLVYPYSVVPGGVENPGELAVAVADDPSVAQHYAKLNFQRARLVRLASDRKLYVSYRKNGQILWTKTPHLIRAGEPVITDGFVVARTRCGNQLASRPLGLTTPEDPTEAQLDAPVAVLGDPVRVSPMLARNSVLLSPLTASGPSSPGTGGGLIGIGPIGGGGGGSICQPDVGNPNDKKNGRPCPNHNPPPPQVPEPGTLALVASGIAALSRRSVRQRLRGLTS